MTPQQKKQIILAAVFCCCLAGIIIVIFPMAFHPIGGPVPVEIRTLSYLNSDDRISDDGIHRTVFRKTGNVMSGKPPLFPDLSPHTSSVFHLREGSDDLYLTIVWYFTDRETFLDKKGVLDSFYLERYGNLSITDLTFDYDEPGNSGNPRHRAAIIHVTGFENNVTSGYFTTLQYPESKSPDFFILYYGTVKSGNLSQQAPYLKTLMKPFFDPESNDTREGGSPQDTQTSASVEYADAVSIALNNSEVQDYLRNGYTLGNVGPLCYERSLSDRKIYTLCFTGVEFDTPDVFLVAYVDIKNGEVNKTSAIYHRNPVVLVNSSVTPR